ncbi:GntR family transcriptional regulator [Plantactinospora sp. KLBMP9567]|uniref:GntR family transcriptional regulator n=1 Tax=Plantactinospora sp. KLBMP9567 TaxID=3085900 RepID=UPI002980D55E|nr:GntR family transcriptional regulator [Plantactinospora sp. KLBMP9567]MDW5328681.1 GntR family transcriptional regulator [Plantactinospora sp. KLBMP9567]
MPASRPFEPHYRRIIADIRRRIASGEWPSGHKLPSTKTLAEIYDVRSQSTVRSAITILIETGELYGHQGLGVFVADRAETS